MDSNASETTNEVQLEHNSFESPLIEEQIDIAPLKENAANQMSEEIGEWQALEQRQQGNLNTENETETSEKVTVEAESSELQNGSISSDPIETGLESPSSVYAGEAFNQHSIPTASESLPIDESPSAGEETATLDGVNSTDGEEPPLAGQSSVADGSDGGSNGDVTHDELTGVYDENAGNGRDTAFGAQGVLCHENGISSEYGSIIGLPTSDGNENRGTALSDQPISDIEESATAVTDAAAIPSQTTSFSAEELQQTGSDAVMVSDDQAQLTSEVEQQDSPPCAALNYVVAGGSNSAAVTPMDEYRHLLRQQDYITASSVTEESQPEVTSCDAVPCFDENRFEHGASCETGNELITEENLDAAPVDNQFNDQLSVDAASVAEPDRFIGSVPIADQEAFCDGTQFTRPADDLLVVTQQQQQQQQQQLPFIASHASQLSPSNSGADLQTISSSPKHESVIQQSSPLFQISSATVVNATDTAKSLDTPAGPIVDELTSRPRELPTSSESQSATEVTGQQRPHQQTVKQPQRPPLLPLTIRTDESKIQSWSGSCGQHFNSMEDNETVSGSSVSPSSLVVNRQHVEKVAPPEITRNVRRMFESGEIADRHQVPKRIVRIEDEMAAESSGVFENQPTVVADDVIRDTGEYVSPSSEVQPGSTKSLLSQWQAKGNEEFRSERRPIVVAEGENVVLENQPAPQRPDVVREDYREPTAELPVPGQARLLRQRFTGNDERQTPKKDAKAAVLAEMAAAAESGTPSVIENVPDRRPDVVREDDTVEEVWLRKGYTRDLAGFWSSPKPDGSGTAARAQIELPKDVDGQSSVYENKPRTLDETVVRGGEYIEESVGIEKGRAKTMAGMWQNRAGDTPVKPRSEPISLEREADRQGAGVYENAPVALEGVVRSTDQVEEIMGQRGLIRNIAERFTSRQDDFIDGGTDRSRVGLSPRRGPVPDMVVIDRADGPAVLENEPTQLRPDVVRSDASGYLDQPNVEPGTTRNLVASWKNKEIENNSPQVSTSGGRQLELDLAPEAGVYENQPETRTDVVRADYDEPEMIPVAQMRSTRAMWSQKELDEQQQQQSDRGSRSGRIQPPEPVRFTPPRERTPPHVVQEDYRSYQSITLQSSAASTPGRQSPASGAKQPQQLASPGAARLSPSVRSPSDAKSFNGSHDEFAEPSTKTSSAVLVFK